MWCSAAVGCQAAAGHLVPALATTAVVLGVHLLLRPVGRLVDRAPAAKDEAVGAFMILVIARRKHEHTVRAQLLQALTAPDIMLQGLSSVTDADDTTTTTGNSTNSTVELRADVLIEGNAASALDALITRLSLEPGIRSVSWRSEDPDLRGDDDRDDTDGDRAIARRRRFGRTAPRTPTGP